MTEVTSKSELKAALERGETEFHTTNENLLYGSALVAKFKKKTPSQYAAESFEKEIRKLKYGLVVEVGTATIVITAMVLVTAIALYAIYKGFDVDVDVPNGKIKARKRH